jgi:ribosomal protein S18 acetylase RimI-like enzyme
MPGCKLRFVSEAVSIVRDGHASIPTYARISIAFGVGSRLVVEPVDDGLRGLCFREEAVMPAYVKDYDALDGGPMAWATQFAVDNWGLLLASSGAVLVGGAALAFECPCAHVAEPVPESACLWDIRVQPEFRGRGVGASLVREVKKWATERGFRHLHAETQNVNVPACRFYRANGFRLVAVHARAYAELPEEAMLLWERELP